MITFNARPWWNDGIVKPVHFYFHRAGWWTLYLPFFSIDFFIEKKA